MWRGALAAFTASVVVVALGGAGAQSAEAAKSTSPWRLLPGASVEVSGTVLGLGWAASRVWFVTPTKERPILHSARLSGGSLTSSTSTPVPGGLISYPIVDGALVLNGLQKGNNRVDGQFTAELLANGGAAEPTPLSDDLVATAKTAVPKVDTVLIRAACRSGVGRSGRSKGTRPATASAAAPRSSWRAVARAVGPSTSRGSWAIDEGSSSSRH